MKPEAKACETVDAVLFVADCPSEALPRPAKPSPREPAGDLTAKPLSPPFDPNRSSQEWRPASSSLPLASATTPPKLLEHSGWEIL